MISSSTTTTHYTEYDTTFRYGEAATGLVFGQGINQYAEGPLFSKKEKHVLDLVSDQPKVLIGPFSFSPYHFIHDEVGEFLAQYEKTPDAKFVIDITNIAEMDPIPSFLSFFFRYLNAKKVDYVPLNFNKINKVNINKFYTRNPASEGFEINNPSPKIYEMALHSVRDKDVPATKKVYISRKNFKGRELSVLIQGRLPYNNDNRMDDEKKVEDYFKSLGFEIAVPEDFKTFEDQVNYFYEAKMVVSSTSSGFINAFFMRPGSTMVEISTPLISFSRLGDGVTGPMSVGQQEVHHFYHMMSIALGHKYISIENKDRSADNVIEIIEGDSGLKGWLTQK
jgi:hypothetical protein